MTTGMFVNAETGETITRDLTEDELAAITETDAERVARLTVEAEANRRGAFAAESDPLFFKWQRGEGTEQAWLDKVAEIRARYPYT